MDARLTCRALAIPNDRLHADSLPHLEISLAILTDFFHDGTEFVPEGQGRLLACDRMWCRGAYVGTPKVSDQDIC